MQFTGQRPHRPAKVCKSAHRPNAIYAVAEKEFIGLLQLRKADIGNMARDAQAPGSGKRLRPSRVSATPGVPASHCATACRVISSTRIFLQDLWMAESPKKTEETEGVE